MPAFAEFRSNRYFSALDGLRALSVLAVIWHHTSGKPGGLLSSRGSLGVDLFFVISGFLITTLLLRERSATGRISLRRFYLRRTLRIFPLYYAVLGLYVVLVLLTTRGTPEGDQFLRNLPAFATYTSNWFVNLHDAQGTTFYFAWSLATEEQFYLLWPALLVACLTLRRPTLFPVVAAGSLIAISVAAQQAGGDALPLVALRSIAEPILYGVIAAVLAHSARGFTVLHRIVGHRPVPVLLFVGLFVVTGLGASQTAVQLVMACLVVSCCVTESSLLHPVLRWRPFRWIGSISYGMYLMHMLAANAVRPLLGHDFGVDVFVGTVVGVLLAAHVSFRWFETPILARKRRFEVREIKGPAVLDGVQHV